MAKKTMKKDTVEPGMESLTCYQANRTRVEVRTVRRNTAGPDSYWNYSLAVKTTGPEWQ